MLTRLAEFVVRRRRWVLVGALLLFVVAGALGGNVQRYLSQGGFEDPHAESTKAEHALQDTFGAGQPNFLLLVTAKKGTVDDPAVAAAGNALTVQLAKEGYIEQAVSYWSLGSPPPLRSKDARKALVLANVKGTQDEMADRVKELAPKYAVNTDLLQARVGGFNEVFHEVGDTIEKNLKTAESIAFPITLILLIFVFGSVVAASLPLAIGALAVVGTFLILRIVASMTEVSVYSTSLVTAMGLGLAIDYSLFIVSRYREELRKGLDTRAAVVRSVQTAGRTVAFGGLTVAIALSALLVFPLAFLRSFAYAGIGVVAFAVGGAVIVLPALLAALGPRIEKLAVHRRKPVNDGEGFWHSAAMFVMRRPVPIATAVILLLLLLGAPFLNAKFGLPDDRVPPVSAPVRKVHDEIRREFDSNESGAVSVVADKLGEPGPHMPEIQQYAVTLSAVRGVSRVDSLAGSFMKGQQVLPPNPLFVYRFARAQGTWLSVVPSVEPNSPAGEAMVKDLRALDRPFPVKFGGAAAQLVDSKASLFGRMPLAAALILLTTFVMLFLMFGSVLVPAKAVVLNLLSLTATFGAMVWIFQEGHFSGFLDFTPTGVLDTTTPILMFCVAFGLSMDYEVFLLSRIKEEHDHGSDNVRSVASGLERTGRIVTAAAATLAVVFIAFATSDITFIKLFGVGLTMAVLVDATLIRAALVPAFMRLAGNANWWAPVPMRRVYERWGIHEIPDDRFTEHAVVDLSDGYRRKLLDMADAAKNKDELHALLEIEGITEADLERWRQPVGERVIASRARPRSRRGEGDQLRREILDKTARLLAKTGDEEAVSILAVANAVGVTPPSIYLHFADKDDLIRAVCEETFQLFDLFVEKRVAALDDPFVQLRARGRAYIDFGVRHPEHYRVLFMGKAHANEDDTVAEASGFAHLLDNVQRCIDNGSIATDDPIVIATGLWTLVHGITSLAVSVPGYPTVGLERLVDHMLDVYGRGLAGS